MKITIMIQGLSVRGNHAVRLAYEEKLSFKEKLLLKARKIDFNKKLVEEPTFNVLELTYDINGNDNEFLLRKAIHDYTLQSMARFGAYPEDYKLRVDIL